MLYIPAVCCAKLSSLAFYVYLTPDKKHLRATRAVQALAIVWTTTAVLATAFQCHLPRPWAITSGHCFDQVSPTAIRLVHS